MASSLEGDLDGSQTEKLAHFQVRNRTEWSPKCAGRIPAGTDRRHERRRVETNSRKIRLESGGTERIKRASPSIIRILDRRRIGSQRKRRRRIGSTTRNATPSLRSSPRRLRRRSDPRSRRPSTVRRKYDICKSCTVREFRRRVRSWTDWAADWLYLPIRFVRATLMGLIQFVGNKDTH